MAAPSTPIYLVVVIFTALELVNETFGQYVVRDFIRGDHDVFRRRGNPSPWCGYSFRETVRRYWRERQYIREESSPWWIGRSHKAYMRDMVKDRQKDVAEFER